jgi:hypothetical protein
LLAGDPLELELQSTPGAAATTICFLFIRNIDLRHP